MGPRGCGRGGCWAMAGLRRSIISGVWVSALLLIGVLASGCATRVNHPLPISNNYPSLSGPVPRFEWPLNTGAVSSGFGERHGVMHQGIDIAAPVGSPIHAASEGEVIFVGKLRGYGNVVILEHPAEYITVYAHVRSNQVREGQRIKQGKIIAYVGTSGHTTGPNLHFEIRHRRVAENPLNYLPPHQIAEQAAIAGGS